MLARADSANQTRAIVLKNKRCEYNRIYNTAVRVRLRVQLYVYRTVVCTEVRGRRRREKESVNAVRTEPNAGTRKKDRAPSKVDREIPVARVHRLTVSMTGSN